MGRDELVDEIEKRMEEPPTLDDDSWDVQRCFHCDAAMPYEDYNPSDPQMDFVVQIVPGAEAEPPSKHIYCSPSCVAEEEQDWISEQDHEGTAQEDSQ